MVYGYVLNATVGVFLRTYDATTLEADLAGGQYNAVTGGMTPTASCPVSYNAKEGTVAFGTRGRGTFTPTGGTGTYRASSWALLLSQFQLPDYMKDTADAIADITADSDNAAPEYYTLQGVRVANPTPGLYICRRGNTATKVIIR